MRTISRQQLREETTPEDREDCGCGGDVFTYEQNETWFTVYKFGEEVDKFQGKDGLEKYGLNES